MPLIALGAETKLFLGVEFISGAELLILIRNYLLTKNWSVISDNITNNLELKIKGKTTNNHECFFIFTAIIQNQRQYLTVCGDANGDGINLSPLFELDFHLGYVNRLWLIADNDSGGLCIRNRFFYSGGISFGFVERIKEDDRYAWHIAFANNRLNDCYIARGQHNSDYWHQIGSSFYNSDSFSLSSCNGPYQGIWDSNVAIPQISATSLSIVNAGYYAHDGKLNAVNNFGLITKRFYLEGYGTNSIYSSNNSQSPYPLYFRGFVKHFYNGFGELSQGAIFPDKAQNVYLSVGSQGWQALKIYQSDISLYPALSSDLNKVIYYGGDSGLEVDHRDRFFKEIRNILLNLDWKLMEDRLINQGITRRLVMRGRYRDKQEYCYFVFSHDSFTNKIEIKGEIREKTGTKVSPGLTIQLNNGNNRFWLTASKQAIALSIDNLTDTTEVYFGYYSDRIDPQDIYAWGLGFVKNDLRTIYVAKSYFDNNYWQLIADDFNYNTTDRASFPSFTTSDRLTTSLLPFEHYNYVDQGNRNSGLYALNGNKNALNNKSALDFFAIIEGRKDKFDYGAEQEGKQKPKGLFYRGYIEFLATGAGGTLKNEVLTTPTGAKFLSTGRKNWQCIQIG